jgi:hypothetical protein
VVDVEVDVEDDDEVDEDEDAIEVELSDMDTVERGRVTFNFTVVILSDVVLGVWVLEVVSVSRSFSTAS